MVFVIIQYSSFQTILEARRLGGFLRNITFDFQASQNPDLNKYLSPFTGLPASGGAEGG
jgi:hypothetical protein